MRTYCVKVRIGRRPKTFGGFKLGNDVDYLEIENVEYPAVEAEDGQEACEHAELLAQLDHPESPVHRAWSCTINPKGG